MRLRRSAVSNSTTLASTARERNGDRRNLAARRRRERGRGVLRVESKGQSAQMGSVERSGGSALQLQDREHRNGNYIRNNNHIRNDNDNHRHHVTRQRLLPNNRSHNQNNHPLAANVTVINARSSFDSVDKSSACA